MKEEDYQRYEQNVLDAIMKFQHLFSDYIKQMNPELWDRAVDYAKDYSTSGNVTLSYVKEKIPENILANTLAQTIFIKELADDIEETREEYLEFVENNKKLPSEQIREKWLKETEYTAEDPFGYEKDLDLFIQCNHKFTFSEFDEDDWFNYTNIVTNCVKDKEFQKTYYAICMALGTESEVYQYFVRCMEEQE